MRLLLDEIERVLPEGGDWCDLEKATQLAALIVGYRPQVVLEIGVWMGGSLIPMALALKHNASRGHPGIAIGIDPWSQSASVIGQTGAHEQWWSQQDHEAAYKVVCDRVEKHELGTIVHLWRSPSDDCPPPLSLDLCHIDGNHSEQAVRDVDRYGRAVNVGGFLVLDDLDWDGGGVSQARELAIDLGFADRYKLGTGILMQRTSSGIMIPT